MLHPHLVLMIFRTAFHIKLPNSIWKYIAILFLTFLFLPHLPHFPFFLHPTTKEDVSKMTYFSKKINTPIEIFLVKIFSDFKSKLIFYLVYLFNSRFSPGLVPYDFQCSFVKPIIEKKTILDRNYLISLLSFLFKI